MKDKSMIIIGVVVIAVVILLAVFTPSKAGLTDAAKFKEEYESLNGTKREKDGKTIRSIEISDANPFVYKTAEEIVEAMDNKETFAVYFGFSDCPWCRSVLPTMIDVANDLDINTIYYVDVKEIRDVLATDEENNVVTDKKGTEGYYKLLEYMNELLEDYNLSDSEGNSVATNEKRIYAPNLVAVVEGHAENLTTGISEKETDPYMELTEEINKEMYAKIKCTLECISKKAAVCEKKNAC